MKFLMLNNRLSKDNMRDIISLTKSNDFPYVLTENVASMYCNEDNPCTPSIHAYGVYDNVGNLMSILTAAFTRVDDINIVRLSRLYTQPRYRKHGHIRTLIKSVEEDAKAYFNAKYGLYDSHLDSLFAKDQKGFDSGHNSQFKHVLCAD